MDLSEFIGKPCVVRARDASPHFGVVTGIDGRLVKMTGARRLWRWRVAENDAGKPLGLSLSDVAEHGLADAWSRVSAPVASALIQDACEVLLCSDVAASSISSFKVATP